jgi:hypothetical protein
VTERFIVAHLSRPRIKGVDFEKDFSGNPFANNTLLQVPSNIRERPFVTRLEGRHHGMVRLVEVPRGVMAGRAVTTADVTASKAEPEMNPRRTQFQALFTALSSGGSGNEPLQVMTAHNGSPDV